MYTEGQLKSRRQYAVIEYDLYPSLEDPSEPDFAPYVRLAECPEHPGVLEPVTNKRVISTGYDDCEVGVFLCGEIVGEDVF